MGWKGREVGEEGVALPMQCERPRAQLQRTRSSSEAGQEESLRREMEDNTIGSWAGLDGRGDGKGKGSMVKERKRHGAHPKRASSTSDRATSD